MHHRTYLVISLLLLSPFQTSTVILAQSDVQERLERIEEKVDRLLAFHELDRSNSPNWRFLSQNCPGQLLNKQFFIICHNENWKISYWVGYYLSKENLRGDTRRTNDFRPDPELETGKRAELTDYRNSGYDRGHMAPAAAFKRSRQAMSTTFSLSNMAPQTSSLNQRIWRLLEEDVRNLANDFGEIWVFTGNLFLDANENSTEPSTFIGSNRVAVPSHCFKAILLRTTQGNWNMYGFIMPNQRGSIPGEVEDYLEAIDEIEAKSGIDFFAEMPDLVENRLESQEAESWPVN